MNGGDDSAARVCNVPDDAHDEGGVHSIQARRRLIQEEDWAVRRKLDPDSEYLALAWAQCIRRARLPNQAILDGGQFEQIHYFCEIRGIMIKNRQR